MAATLERSDTGRPTDNRFQASGGSGFAPALHLLSFGSGFLMLMLLALLQPLADRLVLYLYFYAEVAGLDSMLPKYGALALLAMAVASVLWTIGAGALCAALAPARPLLHALAAAVFFPAAVFCTATLVNPLNWIWIDTATVLGGENLLVYPVLIIVMIYGANLNLRSHPRRLAKLMLKSFLLLLAAQALLNVSIYGLQ